MDKKIIKTYLFDISSLNDEIFNKLIVGVKSYRKEKIDKLSLKNSKYLSLAVELLIKKACDDFDINYLDEEIVFNEFGKPSFKNSKMYFNTAHSGKYAICVISDKEVGIDIEEIKEYKVRVADRFFSKKENNYIDLASDKNDMFYRIWTIKEAYLKAKGTGLSSSLSSFEVNNHDNNIVIKGDDSYQFIEVKYNNYRIAYCLKINEKEKEKYHHDISLIQFN